MKNLKGLLIVAVAIVAAVIAYLGFAGKNNSTTSTNEQANNTTAETAEAKKERKLYVYNWTEYITTDLLNKFEKQTGIKVVYSTYESNEEMYAKLKINQSSAQPYDIVVPSNHYSKRLIVEGLVKPLDKALIHFENVNEGVLGKNFDPNNEFSVPYTYGFTTIGINKSFAPNLEIKSWADLWKPAYNDLMLLRDQRDVFSMALKSLGKDPNTKNEEDIKAAYEKLKSLVSKVRTYNSDAPEVPFVNNEVMTGMTWSGSMFRGWLDDKNISVVWPEEGAIEFIDSFMIPKGSQNTEEAIQFINFMLEPENAAEIVKNLGWSVPNNKIAPYLPAEWANNIILFPPKEALEKATLTEDVGDAALELYNKYWNMLSVE